MKTGDRITIKAQTPMIRVDDHNLRNNKHKIEATYITDRLEHGLKGFSTKFPSMVLVNYLDKTYAIPKGSIIT